jgi:hypothetical protein
MNDDERIVATMKLVSEGRISIGKAGELLDLSIWDLQAIAEKYNIRYGPTAEQMKQSHEALERILSDRKAKKSSASA